MEAAGAAISNGDRIGAERALRTAIKAVEGVAGTELEQASAFTRLGALQQEMGNDGDAEQHFRKALEISEGHLGEDHPDLVLLLNDLTRLYLKQSAYAQAEPLLLRLLAIKRGKGDDHPEVATVLASLATVRQALGRYEAAEQLWRRVLGIRERTLAPNHFSVATAIEHLAETCAARGKVGEALQLFERAYVIREHTLGVDHPSLRPSRERIADLQLQASEDSLGLALPSGYETRRLPSVGAAIAPAVGAAAESFAPPASGPKRTPEQPEVMPETAKEPPGFFEPATIGVPGETAKPRAPDTAAYFNALLDLQHDMEEESGLETAHHSSGRLAAMVAASTALFQRHKVAAIVGIGVLTLPVGALAIAGATRSAQGSRWVVQSSSEGFPRRDSVPASSLALPELAGRPFAPRDSGVGPRANGTKASTARPADATVSAKPEDEATQADVPRIVVPSMPQAGFGKLDSVVKALSVPVRTAAESMPLQLAASAFAEQARTPAPGFESVNTGVRARLIGEVPTPRYPASLLSSGIGGEVRVRFDVDTTGRPVMSTFSVVNSPSASLTAAVRKVIPSMRFEPARTAAPDSHAIVEKVEMGFQFAPPGR